MTGTAICATCAKSLDCCNAPLKFIVTPGLSVGHEHTFDPDATDLFVVLNGQTGFAALTDAIHRIPIVQNPDDNPDYQVAARVRTVIAGFPKMPDGRKNMRVACGIFGLALTQAILLESKRVTLVLGSHQYGGDLERLASVLACRARQVVTSQPEEIALKEIEILCRLQDEDAIKEGLKSTKQVCEECFIPGCRSRT